MRRYLTVLPLLLAALAVNGCDSLHVDATFEQPTKAAVTMPTQAPEPTAEPATQRPQPTATTAGAGTLAAVFAGLDKMVSNALGVPITADEALFSDFITGGDVPSYQLTAKGTGADLQDMATVSDKIERVFATLGWERDVTYGATGVASSTIGYHQGMKLCVVTIATSPSDDADCPKGTPIMNCNLRPEQTLFTITLECMLR